MILRGSHTGVRRAAWLLFIGVYFFSGLSRVGTSFDSRWTVYIAMNIWDHGVTNLDRYPDAIRANDYYALECIDAAGNVRFDPQAHCPGHWYNIYPIGGPVLTAPLIVSVVGILRLFRPILSHIHIDQPVIAGFLRADYQAGMR